MTVQEDIARKETLERLAQSRAEIRRALEPTPRGTTAGTPDAASGPSDFPRSKTMRLLMSGKGIGTVGAVVGGLLIARPALALRLLRMVPTNAVAKMLLVKAVTAFRSRQD